MAAGDAQRAARCAVIAEAGVNHDGSLARAKELVRVAAAAGADAVKFQTFRAESVACAAAPAAAYQRPCGARDQRELLRGLELRLDDFRALAALCAGLGIEFLSTPYGEESVELLAAIPVARFKVASGELTNPRLLRRIGRERKPVILSTGMAELAEIERALAWLREAEAGPITLLHCTSSYPTQPEDCHLRAMQTLRDRFGLPVGYSDHTLGHEVACAAVALGAVMIEKHFTLDRSAPGPDHRASLEPEELAALVRAVRVVEAALGDSAKRPSAGEREALALARRGLKVARDLPAGAQLRAADVCLQRPATGIAAADLDRVLGRRLREPLRAGAALEWDHLA
jgi:N-acetylneuraminate synthase/N,N'-diacetyllegionaminate synthase